MDISRLPEKLTVYRGAAGIPPALAVKGSSWSLHRDVACAYASTIRGNAGAPVVIKREIRRSEILMLAGDLSAELVLAPPVDRDSWTSIMSPGKIAKLAPRGMARMNANTLNMSAEQTRIVRWMAAGSTPDHSSWGRGVSLRAQRA
jgi:hypothetical protein